MNAIRQGNESGWPNEVFINTDGASRGNPGPASLGYTVTDGNGDMVYEYGEALGSQTNNYAEYMAVKSALAQAVENAVERVHVRSDSQLLIRQLMGEYKVKSETLRPIYQECVSLAGKIPKVTFEHVRREFNKRADELANLVLDL